MAGNDGWKDGQGKKLGVGDSMDDADGALLNRMLSLYDCGSVFKIVTTIAALENGFSCEIIKDLSLCDRVALLKKAYND